MRLATSGPFFAVRFVQRALSTGPYTLGEDGPIGSLVRNRWCLSEPFSRWEDDLFEYEADPRRDRDGDKRT
jgi:hypothetical protein